MQNQSAGNEENDELDKFFSLLKRQNEGLPMNPEVCARIEAYFDYKWNKDCRYQFFNDKFKCQRQHVTLDLLIPLFTEFIFFEFNFMYGRYFQLPMETPRKNKYARFNWYTEPYQRFMITMMEQLEPLKLERGQVLY